MIEFAWPWLAVLLPLPYFVYRWAPPSTQEQSGLVVPFFSRLAQLKVDQENTLVPSSLWFRLLAYSIWLLLITSICRPQWVGDPIPIASSARDVMLAVDVSGSMKRADMTLNGEKVNRLQVIKKIVGEFVDQREGDRLGLILFGTRAYLQAPLTFDLKTINTFLQEAMIGIAGEHTAIGDAIGLAIKRLSQQPDNQRVLVLLSDGGDTASEVNPIKAAELAAQSHIKIYTVGVGADEMIEEGFLFDRKVNPSRDLDETTLQEIANKTGGKYFRAKNTQELQQIYSEIAAMEPITQEDRTFRPQLSLMHYPLGVALILSFLLAFLLHRSRQ